MKNLGGKIAFVIFVILSGIVIYLSLSLESKKEIDITIININGNVHLPKNSYFEYANLHDKQNYDLLSLSVIRDRLQKHPYIKQVTVGYAGNGKVIVNLIEKEFKAILLTNGERFLMTSKMEALPVLENSQNINYPVIQINSDNRIKPFQIAASNSEIKTAFKMLTAAKLLNPSLYDNLSEIDFRNKRNAVIYFSSVDYPVIIGRENEIKKLVVFERLWENISTVQANKLLEYVDLRFTDKVYLGIAGENLQVEETQS
ncbi:MAG TPA: FtsQ-type POTRA domain-containing protein [Ignavibacteria bacterium]|nr:FtsQ-type POTRA domain-containing protein [Ignavibacteria bacterium]